MRSEDGGILITQDLEIDSSGEIFGEGKFNDIIGLKDTIIENPHWFMRSFIEHMLSYSLGRELDISDKPYMDKILSKVLLEKGKFSTVVTEITKSYPFMNKTNQSKDNYDFKKNITV